MRTVTIGVSGIAEAQARLSAAFRGEKQCAFISFSSVELLWTVMTPRRWELLRAPVGHEPQPLSALSDRLGRNADELRADIDALAKAGVVERVADDRVSFPFDSVHVDFTMAGPPEGYPSLHHRRFMITTMMARPVMSLTQRTVWGRSQR